MEVAAVENNGYNYLGHLAPELIFQILKNLDIKSLCGVKVTCKHFNQTLEDDKLWKKHCLALRAVCPSEVDEDLNKGLTWKETLQRSYSKTIIKQQWLDGIFSNIASYSELPPNSMLSLSVDSWEEILDAEFARETQ